MSSEAIERIRLAQERRKRLAAVRHVLVQKAEEVAESIPGRPADFGRSALRNVLEVAKAEPHPLLVRAFVQYQAGREEKKWTETRLADALLNALDEVWKMSAGDKGTTGQDEAMDRVRVFLGYLCRAERYVPKAEAPSREKRR